MTVYGWLMTVGCVVIAFGLGFFAGIECCRHYEKD